MRVPKAYLEKSGEEWYDDFVYISKEPLIRRGYKIIPFDGSDLENTLLNKSFNLDEDIVIGTVEAVTAVLNINNIIMPPNLSYPKQLESYLGRDVTIVNYKDVGSDFPYFLKPAENVKLFTGDVITKESDFIWINKNKVLPKTKVYKSSILEFESEYRCFITNGEIRGMKHYTGDFKFFPNMHIIEEMVKEYTDCPSAYTLDVGIATDGCTYLVEVNDMWAVGSYGFDGEDYALLSARRFKEIIRDSNFEKVRKVKEFGFKYIEGEITGWVLDSELKPDVQFYPNIYTIDEAYTNVLAKEQWDLDKVK